MKRLFYFTGHRLSVYHWDGRRCAANCTFEPDDNGYEKFEFYLNNSAKIASKLLVDVIEEDFRVETVPHVFGKDRKAVIDRMLDRFYRASNVYTYSEIIGREKGGRKDNRVLLGALTNPELIGPWLEIIDRCDVPLSGIWSMPVISKDLLPIIGVKTGATLVVSQQVNSNLRQTFYRDRKMISSRQSVINQDAGDISNIGHFARPEVDRTIQFLRSQQHIEIDEMVDIHIIADDEQLDSIESSFKSNEMETIHVHRISDIEDQLKIGGGGSKFSDRIFAHLCMEKFSLSGHYGNHEEKERYFYSLMSSALYAASIIILIAGLLITESNISDALQLSRSQTLLVKQEQEFRTVYKKKFEQYEEVFANAGEMNAAVDLVRQIKQHGDVTPLDLMLEVSKVLGRPGYSDVSIDSIDWRAEQTTEKKGEVRVVDKPKIFSDEPYRHTAVIDGRIAISRDNYSASVDRVDDIIDALKDHERVISVEPISMPVEVRSDRKFSAESGVSKNEDRSDEGEFSIKVIMQGEYDA